MYGQVMANQKWMQIDVTNPEFVQARPCSGIQLSSTEMLIFGGDSTKTFTFDTRQTSGVGNIATVKTA